VVRGIALVLAAVLLLVAATQPAPAASKRARCAAKGAKTLKANRLVKVYARRDSQGNRTLFGCWRKSGRKLKLAEEYDDQYVTSGVFREVRLEGRFVAFVFEATDMSCKAGCPPDYDPTTTTVRVSDLRARRGRSAVADEVQRTLRLSTAGVAVWLAPVADGSQELRAIDGAGRGRLIDSGRIDPDFIRLSGLRLEWVGTEGVPKTADLTPF
jgi:hypothetical protein